MLILRQKMRAKPDKSDELMAALAEIIAPARATDGTTGVTSGGAQGDGDAAGIAGGAARANHL